MDVDRCWVVARKSDEHLSTDLISTGLQQGPVEKRWKSLIGANVDQTLGLSA